MEEEKKNRKDCSRHVRRRALETTDTYLLPYGLGKCWEADGVKGWVFVSFGLFALSTLLDCFSCCPAIWRNNFVWRTTNGPHFLSTGRRVYGMQIGRAHV